MENLIKLVDNNMSTFGGHNWEVGKKYILPYSHNPRLASESVYHAYRDVDVSLLFNPIHAQFLSPMIFEATSTKIIVDDYSKVGVYDLMLDKKIDVPSWYQETETRRDVQLQFAVLCSKSVSRLLTEDNMRDMCLDGVSVIQKYLDNHDDLYVKSGLIKNFIFRDRYEEQIPESMSVLFSEGTLGYYAGKAAFYSAYARMHINNNTKASAYAYASFLATVDAAYALYTLRNGGSTLFAVCDYCTKDTTVSISDVVYSSFAKRAVEMVTK